MFAPWKKSYEQPRQHIKKQRHYLPTKVRLVKAMVFPVVMYGCEIWTIKKAENLRTDTFVGTLHHDLSILGGLHGMAHCFIELDEAVVHVTNLISFL